MPQAATLTLADALPQLAAIVDVEHTHLGADAFSVAPANAEQISAILRFGSERGLTVTPTGAGTKLGWGNPVAPHIRLALNRMNALREHSWQDMTCGVEAGCSWAAMQAQLARHGQMVALDPLWPVRATVGGIVATNDGGPLRIRYGGLRDLIIGMTVVLADGTIAKTGGKVVKNVAGYDLHKLMTGSFGTLGVITEVNFRLHPLEVQARTWSAEVADPLLFEAPLRTLLDSHIIPSGLQLRVDAQQCAIDIRVSATPACLDDHAGQLTKFFAEIPVHESNESVWQARQNLFDQPGVVILKVSVLPSQICSTLSQLQAWSVAEGAEFAAVAQCNGLVNIALKAKPDTATALIERLRLQCNSVVILQFPAELHGHIDPWGFDSTALPLMREIKRRFDPERILNPGRFVGNI
ncbi:MAG TPA: FAD-binding oxidoreductase [Terracidiphilus sp.]|nr:FAD-binding oxidoreductase [Terracidiphilus sp.]